MIDTYTALIWKSIDPASKSGLAESLILTASLASGLVVRAHTHATPTSWVRERLYAECVYEHVFLVVGWLGFVLEIWNLTHIENRFNMIVFLGKTSA